MIKRKAFSLVELLVVIAIISVLAGLLMPALDDAIGSARSIECLNILKLGMLATTQYADDNKGWSPPADPSVLNSGAASLGRLMFHGYLPEAKFYHSESGKYYHGYLCPEYPSDCEETLSLKVNGGYGTNFHFTGNFQPGWSWVPTPYFPILKNNNPSKVYYFAEGLSYLGGVVINPTKPKFVNWGLSGIDSCPVYRHVNESMPIGFLDGHGGMFVASETIDYDGINPSGILYY